MTGIKHEAKKRVAKAKTSNKKIEKGISAEFIDCRQKISLVATSVKSLLKEIKETGKVWAEVTRHQRSFAENLVSAIPTEGAVRQHAREVETASRNLERAVLQDDKLAPHHRILTVLDNYLTMINTLEKEYPSVETSYSEVLRYERKVEKLAKKGRSEAHTRNIDKLHTTRAQHDEAVRALIERMHTVYDKHEAVFQCAHHAFWIAHDNYSKMINGATHSIRLESLSTKDQLINIDVTNAPRLAPVQRVRLILPPSTHDTSSTQNIPHSADASHSSAKPVVTEISDQPLQVPSSAPPPTVTVISPTTDTSAHTQSVETPKKDILPTPPTELPPPPPSADTKPEAKASFTSRLFRRSKHETAATATKDAVPA